MSLRKKIHRTRRHSKPVAPETGWRRGSVGSARVWDEETRTALRSGLPLPPPLPPSPPAQKAAPEPQGARAATPPPPAVSVPKPPQVAPAPPQPLPELSPKGHALLQRLISEVPEIDRLPGMRHALATLISRSDLEQAPASPAQGISSSTRELELLRRRANKLVRELRSTRTEVQRVAKQKEVDTGVASRYRGVQGLEEATPNSDAKRGMLEDIFRANLELRREAS